MPEVSKAGALWNLDSGMASGTEKTLLSRVESMVAQQPHKPGVLRHARTLLNTQAFLREATPGYCSEVRPSGRALEGRTTTPTGMVRVWSEDGPGQTIALSRITPQALPRWDLGLP